MDGVIETVVGEYVVIEALKEKLTDIVKLLTDAMITFVFSNNCIYIPLNW